MMKNRFFLICLIAIAVSFFVPFCYAQELEEIPEFTKNDRVLFMAPHPDDEAIGTAGAIQRALKVGAQIKVVCYTNGDANQFAFIVYEKRLTVRKREFLHMGEVRRKETVRGMSFLGLSPDHVIFLGYPDFGTMTILTKYWDKAKPYKSIFTRVSKVSYPEAFSMNAPYVGESILKDLKTILLDFKPTKIFVSHPADTNREHRSLYLFLQIALWDLEGSMKRPQIFPYLIHVVGWPKPRGYHPDLELKPPLKTLGVLWQELSLTPEEIKKKHDCIAFYKSEIEYNPPYLFTYARKNELFGDYPALKLKQQTKEEVDWQAVEIAQKEDEDTIAKDVSHRTIISALAYACYDNELWVRITTKRKIDKDYGSSLFLLGYNKKRDFATIPKIHIHIGFLGAKIRDKKEAIRIKGFKIAYEKNAVILKIPLSSLGDPDYILSSANASGFPHEATAWRILELE